MTTVNTINNGVLAIDYILYMYCILILQHDRYVGVVRGCHPSKCTKTGTAEDEYL